MQAVTEKRSRTLPIDRERAWPLDARMAMFVLESGGHDPAFPRERATPRHACRMMGTLCGSDPRALAHAVVFVRDMTAGHFGVICQSEMKVGSTVWLHCRDGEGISLRAKCRIGRSRTFMRGWHEGVLNLCDE